MHHLCRRLQFCSGVTQGRTFLVVLVLDLVQVCGEEWVGLENSLDWNWGVRTGIEMAVLPPEIWAASSSLLPGHLCPRWSAKLWCRVHGAGALPWLGEEIQSLCGTAEHVLAVAATILPGSHPHPQASCLGAASPGLFPWPEAGPTSQPRLCYGVSRARVFTLFGLGFQQGGSHQFKALFTLSGS